MSKQSWNADTVVKKSNPPQATEFTSVEKRKFAADVKGDHDLGKAKKKASVEMSYTMHYKKDTPGTYVYASDDPDAFVNQVYVRKGGMPDGAQKSITITVR